MTCKTLTCSIFWSVELTLYFKRAGRRETDDSKDLVSQNAKYVVLQKHDNLHLCLTFEDALRKVNQGPVDEMVWCLIRRTFSRVKDS